MLFIHKVRFRAEVSLIDFKCCEVKSQGGVLYMSRPQTFTITHLKATKRQRTAMLLI
ncbi:hypothetical protein [Helicobacter trogontum]|uniref:hypothetical protein n=1 Tax=Helicobacter trogontum TaxID=50960 RepID=UPI000A5FAC9B|nr:hypothetical protein [Helicobacter trogontum]